MQNKHDTSNTIFLDRFLASCDTFLMDAKQNSSKQITGKCAVCHVPVALRNLRNGGECVICHDAIQNEIENQMKDSQ